MQVFVEGPKLDVNHTHTVDKSVAPAESAYCNANVCCTPLPDSGATDVASSTGPVIGATAGCGTVQDPSGCHPLTAPPADAEYV